MSEVVNKPWGSELIWAKTDKYVGKILTIRKGCQLSRQFHQVKDETIYVLEGSLLLELGTVKNLQQKVLMIGESYHIKPSEIHRFCAVNDDVQLLEVSTPELDDVIRLEDSYGRVNK